MWILAPELFTAEQLFVADDKRDLEMGVLARLGSWSSVPWSHPNFVLEFSLISVVSVCWGNERKKNTEKEMGSERKWRKERKKKKCSEIEREETLPSKTNTFLPHTILGCSYSGVAVERKTIFETKFYLLSLCGYMVKKEPHHTTFFLFFVKATQWITFGLWILGSLLQTII